MKIINTYIVEVNYPAEAWHLDTEFVKVHETESGKFYREIKGRISKVEETDTIKLLLTSQLQTELHNLSRPDSLTHIVT